MHFHVTATKIEMVTSLKSVISSTWHSMWGCLARHSGVSVIQWDHLRTPIHLMVVELASLVIRWMIMGKLVSLHFYVQKKVNVTPHRDFGRTKGAMHEEVFVQHLAHYKSLHPSVCVYLLLASWLVVALSMLLSSTVTGGKKPIMATVQRYSSQVSLETGWP